jgi:hypothetical protein
MKTLPKFSSSTERTQERRRFRRKLKEEDKKKWRQFFWQKIALVSKRSFGYPIFFKELRRIQNNGRITRVK